MGSLFGGGNDDGGANAIAQAQLQASQQAQASEDRRWQAEQDRIAKDKADAAAKTAADTQATEEALARQRQAQQNQSAAAGAAPVFDPTRSTQQAVAAASTQNGSGLPGLDALRKRMMAPPTQSNSLLSQSNFNVNNVGGRRYV